MPPLDRRIYVRARGADWFDWKSVQVEKSILNCAAGFELTAVDRGSAQMVPGDEIEIRCGDQVALKGFVEGIEDAISDTEHSLKFVGRETNADLIDTAANPEGPLEYLDLNLYELIQKLTSLRRMTPNDPFGFDFTFDADLGGPAFGDARTGFGEPFTSFAIEHGESRWSAIERACRLRGVLAYGDGRKLVVEKAAQRNIPRGPITDPINDPTVSFSMSTLPLEIQNALREMGDKPGFKVPHTLEYGENILSATLTLKDTDRFSTYLVRGQQSGTDASWGAATTEIEGRAEDNGVGRNRTLVIIGEGQLSKQSAELRAQWEATVRAAQAQKLVVVTPGWTLPKAVSGARQDSGLQLWPLNMFVPVIIPKMRIVDDMLIESVLFSKNEQSGTTSELRLVRGNSYVPMPVIEDAGGPFENYLRDRGVRPSARPEEDLGEE